MIGKKSFLNCIWICTKKLYQHFFVGDLVLHIARHEKNIVEVSRVNNNACWYVRKLH